jgi:hypothetical protein
MTPDGILFLEEWVGPSRTEWNDSRLAKMRALFAELPQSWRVCPVLQPPIVVNDPSEAIRSSAILPAVRRVFHVLGERPYGGHLVAVILSQLCRDSVPDEDRQALIRRLLALEESDLAHDPSSSYHVVVVARRKTRLARASGHARTFLVQLGVSARYGIETTWQVLIARPIRAARDTRAGRELVRRVRPFVRRWRAAR